MLRDPPLQCIFHSTSSGNANVKMRVVDSGNYRMAAKID
jgi:hypothetical protein